MDSASKKLQLDEKSPRRRCSVVRRRNKGGKTAKEIEEEYQRIFRDLRNRSVQLGWSEAPDIRRREIIRLNHRSDAEWEAEAREDWEPRSTDSPQIDFEDEFWDQVWTREVVRQDARNKFICFAIMFILFLCSILKCVFLLVTI